VFKLIAASAVVFAGLGFVDTAEAQFFCWFDDAGVQHCGDRVPPEYANRDRDVRNERGVVVGQEEGEITPEERAEMDRAAAEEATRLADEQERKERDQVLLDSYLTVEAIEALRDRRLEIMDSQIRVTELLLRNLKTRLEQLMNDAQRYAPYSDKEGADPVPENLALDIERTESAIALRESALTDIRATQEQMREEFQRDIERFRELKGERVPIADAGSDG